MRIDIFIDIFIDIQRKKRYRYPAQNIDSNDIFHSRGVGSSWAPVCTVHRYEGNERRDDKNPKQASRHRLSAQLRMLSTLHACTHTLTWARSFIITHTHARTPPAACSNTWLKKHCWSSAAELKRATDNGQVATRAISPLGSGQGRSQGGPGWAYAPPFRFCSQITIYQLQVALSTISNIFMEINCLHHYNIPKRARFLRAAEPRRGAPKARLLLVEYMRRKTV